MEHLHAIFWSVSSRLLDYNYFMRQEMITQLLAINHQFYQTFAGEFSATRQRLQPGVMRVVDSLPPNARILDLGCGNGELWRTLAARGHRGGYVGLDFSAELLETARIGNRESRIENQESKIEDQSPNPQSLIPDPQFLIADLGAPDWDAGLEPGSFDVVLAFAALHHLPPPLHGQILRKARALLAPPPPSTSLPLRSGCSPAPSTTDDQKQHPPPRALSTQPAIHHSQFSIHNSPLFILSNWQFLNSPRWRARVQPWETVGLSPGDVGPDDYLLDWRRGGTGYRYVHHFSEGELAALAAETGFRVVETFYSDGKEGNLGLYSVWECG